MHIRIFHLWAPTPTGSNRDDITKMKEYWEILYLGHKPEQVSKEHMETQICYLLFLSPKTSDSKVPIIIEFHC